MEIEKVKCSTPDFAEENAAKLLKLFPECAGELGTVDLDKLRQVLSSKVVEGNVERYEFTWPGKRAAKAAASAATTKTLRPCREESVNFDSTENLYIEGDNLEVLKLLQTSYAGKVKMIYIDPPYNTGHDFVYRDRFSMTDKELATVGGAISDENGMGGGIFAINDGAEARYHSNWCSMMYPRLKLARNLLRDDGVLFMSIDDNEVMNARKLCDEIFGEVNFRADVIWQKRYTRSNNTVDFTTVVEHVLVYGRSECFEVNLLPRTEDADNLYTNPDNDPRGPWKGASFLNPATPEKRPNLCYPITNPNTGVTTYPTTNAWRRSKENFDQLQKDGLLYWGKDGSAKVPSIKMFLSEARGLTPINFWSHEYAGNTDDGTSDMAALMGKVFDNPKPVLLLKRVLEHGSFQDSLVLDFFSGSASTAHAVMQLNAEDGGSRKFIMVQLPETCSEDSEAAKAGYKNICEIGKERIRRAGKKIAEENATTAPNLDVGFRVLKLDSSSLNDTSSTVSETSQAFENFDRIKSDRSPEDLLFQMLLETHIPLSDTIETKTICGNSVFLVADGVLAACLDQNAKMTTEFFIEVAKLKPGIAFFRDDAFADDSARTNLQQAFDQFSPSTSIKVI